MADYIEFKLNGRLLRLNSEDSNDLQVWRDIWGGVIVKDPYWRKVGICKSGSGGYLNSRICNRTWLLHRIVYFAHNPDWDINDCSKKNQIDHIDGDRTNNHISNLRVVTQAQNQQNTKRKGYTYNKREQKWKAYIKLNGKRKHLGYYDTEEEAKQARAEAVKKYHPYNMRQS
jgi:hypothetical protein